MSGRNADVPTEATISRVLGRLGFEIRVVEDISQRHAKLAVRGWRDAVRALPGRPEATDAAVLVQAASFGCCGTADPRRAVAGGALARDVSGGD